MFISSQKDVGFDCFRLIISTCVNAHLNHIYTLYKCKCFVVIAHAVSLFFPPIKSFNTFKFTRKRC